MPDPAMWRCCLLGLFAIRRSGLLAIRRYVTHSLRSMHSVYADAPRNSRPVSGQHNATRYTGPWASTRGVCSGAARILRGDAVTCHAHPGRQHRVNHGRTGGTSPTTSSEDHNTVVHAYTHTWALSPRSTKSVAQQRRTFTRLAGAKARRRDSRIRTAMTVRECSITGNVKGPVEGRK